MLCKISVYQWFTEQFFSAFILELWSIINFFLVSVTFVLSWFLKVVVLDSQQANYGSNISLFKIWLYSSKQLFMIFDHSVKKSVNLSQKCERIVASKKLWYMFELAVSTGHTL